MMVFAMEFLNYQVVAVLMVVSVHSFGGLSKRVLYSAKMCIKKK